MNRIVFRRAPRAAWHNLYWVKKLDLIYFDAGGGHRAAANALKSVIDQQKRPFELTLVNLQEALDAIDVFRKLTGVRLQDIYNLMLKKGWTLGSPQLTAGMHLVIRLFHSQQVKVLRDLWRKRRPDIVVSLVPNLNRALFDSLHRELPGVPLVTILTDLADYPPHFWIERQRQHFIVGSSKAQAQAAAMGHQAQYVHRVSGMILNPTFYDVPPPEPRERSEARRALGFDPEKPVGLVLFGGQGASAMLDIARRLSGRQLILICGHNQKLTSELRRLAKVRGAPVFVEGFTKEVPRYMQLADYFIGKPGPGSLSEAAAMRLPVIVEQNAWTLPQERYNAEWVREQGIGIVLRNFRLIAQTVERTAGTSGLRAFSRRHRTHAQSRRI